MPKVWPDGVSVSVIGRIVDEQPIFNEQGVVIEPATYKPGWHVNVCYNGDINLTHLEQYEIEVNSPRRIWFGQLK